MTEFVADTSALVSLGITADRDPDPLSICLSRYELFVPTAVIKELDEIASYDDVHGRAATTVLNQTHAFETPTVDIDADFPLDDGENSAVTLANSRDTALLLCDEFNQLGLIHASLADTRLVTTPTLLSIFVRTGHLSAANARTLLDEISESRSWSTNSYVQRARSLLKKTE